MNRYTPIERLLRDRVTDEQMREYEAWQQEQDRAEIVAEVKRLNAEHGGHHTCDGDHCLGEGLTRWIGEDCAYCDDIEAAIWQAGEPD